MLKYGHDQRASTFQPLIRIGVFCQLPKKIGAHGTLVGTPTAQVDEFAWSPKKEFFFFFC